MSQLRTWSLFVLASIAALVGVTSLDGDVPPAVSTALKALVIVGTGAGAKVLSTRRRRACRADRSDSVEHEYEAAAAATSLQVMLVLLVSAGTCLLLVEERVAAAALYGTTALTVATYWLAYASARRRL